MLYWSAVWTDNMLLFCNDRSWFARIENSKCRSNAFRRTDMSAPEDAQQYAGQPNSFAQTSPFSQVCARCVHDSAIEHTD